MRIEADVPRRRLTSLTALIDIVFLLLLFFMLASTFSRFASVDVAVGGSGAPATVSQSVVLLTVAADGRYAVNGSQVDGMDLAQVLLEAARGADARILVRPVGEASMQDVVRALERVSAAGAGDVVLVR